MSWPLSQDLNEAVQNPRTAFSDPDLKLGRVTTGPLGVPLPRSGNYADVYQVTDAQGMVWAVKCFTRPTQAELAGRYQAIADHLKQANLPFSIGFNLLPEGIRVRKQWYPIVKMQWVEGLPINQFVKDNLGRATILENMLSLWVRLCRRMRETGMAHCDLQHGNVLLVPAEGGRNSLGLKLVDYDGVYVPALKGKPSGELGHASYQHPERARSSVFSPDLDRFPHLVVVTALRALLVCGQSLWDKYDNGDNLLFTERDFVSPGQSPLFRELWDTGDAFTVGLIAHLALASEKPLASTPWVDTLMPGGQPPILTPSQERQAAKILGISIPVSLSGERPLKSMASAEEPAAQAVADPPIPVATTRPTPPPLPALARVVPRTSLPPQDTVPVARRLPNSTGLLLALTVGSLTFSLIVLTVVWWVGPQLTDRTIAGASPETPSAVAAEPAVDFRPGSDKSEAMMGREAVIPAPAPPPAPMPQLVAIVTRERAPMPKLVLPNQPVPVVAASARPPRLPIPGDELRAKAELQLREQFKAEYARKALTDRRKLAERLFKEAGVASDATERFVYFRELLALALELNDPALAVRAIDGVEDFAIDAPREKLSILEKMTASSTNSNLLRAAAEVAIEQAELLVEKDDYASSLKLMDLAVAWLNQAGAHVLLREVESRRLLWKQQKELFEPVRLALVTLQSQPLDPQANRIVGRFRGFTQGRWEDASAHLLASADPILEKLGRVESKADPDPEATDLSRAEVWDAHASSAPEAEKAIATARARHWYGRALASTIGEERLKVEEKLGFRVGDVEYRPGIVLEAFSLPGPRKLQTRIDPIIDIQARDFRRVTGTQVQLKWTGRLLPPTPGKYRLIAETTDAVRVSLGSPGDEKILIDAKTGQSKSLEAVVTLTEQSRPITITYFSVTDPKGNHGLVLKWVRPGQKDAEPVPMSALFCPLSEKNKFKP